MTFLTRLLGFIGIIALPVATANAQASDDPLIQWHTTLNQKITTMSDSTQGMDDLDSATLKMLELKEAYEVKAISSDEMKRNLEGLEKIISSAAFKLAI